VSDGPSLRSEAVRTWAGDWADQYDQTFDAEALEKWVGKNVRIRAVVKDEPKGHDGYIVGFSIAQVFTDPDDEDGGVECVRMCSLITFNGLAVPLFAGATIEEFDDNGA
jgi:hypothetical protein